MSKTFELIAAGFGGQGVLSLGQIVAYSAMYQGIQTTWLPSYGPEMRGGTANCSVVVSDEPVANPMINHPNVLVAMNRPSLDKFASKVVSGGYIFINSSLIDEKIDRTDVNVYYVPTLDIATKVGNPKGINVVMLGAMLEVTKMLETDKAIEGLEYFFSKKPQVIEINKQMLAAGMDYIKNN
ncbi:MAG: 2-oxoacid:acceptor oxidoreductase family protein [Clostridia bacterium]|nr:2-oxoacid:acceptor oxidoreductase family protein [Clostridia bacterium]